MCALHVGAPGSTTRAPPELIDRAAEIRIRVLEGRVEHLVGASGGPKAAMTEKRRGRVSIGLYTGAGVLWPTVVRLLDRGFLHEQIGIASLASTAERLASPAMLSFPEWKRIEGLLGSLEVVEGPGGLMLAASRNVRVPTALRAKDACATGIISLRASRVWSELEQPIVGGATALAVVASSTEQQWRGTRILLEQSAYPVQTHEIRPGSGPCPVP